MKTTAVIGEAAGTAAAHAHQHQQSPRALANDSSGIAAVQQQLLQQGAYLPRLRNTDPKDLGQRDDVTVTASSVATLSIDTTPGSTPIWEYAGISDAESTGLASELTKFPEGRWLPLTSDHGQAIVISSGELASVVLPLENTSGETIELDLIVRQASHLRDFLGESELGKIHATIAPGRQDVVFTLDQPIACVPETPVVLFLAANPEISWAQSWQEPPGTQAGHWDSGLNQWRWVHGTLGFALTPETKPFSPVNVVNGITRPEVGANLWISDPLQPMPQWLELSWPTPQRIDRVELTFDSQLSGWIWEGAFPLIPDTYEIEVFDGTEWIQTANVDHNVQRRCVHTFVDQLGTKLRVTIHATHGGRTARIFEIRAYTDN
jgi:hypothetical protein